MTALANLYIALKFNTTSVGVYPSQIIPGVVSASWVAKISVPQRNVTSILWMPLGCSMVSHQAISMPKLAYFGWVIYITWLIVDILLDFYTWPSIAVRFFLFFARIVLFQLLYADEVEGSDIHICFFPPLKTVLILCIVINWILNSHNQDKM